MSVEPHPVSLHGMADDRLATAAVSLAVAELRWTPDVTPAVMDRISRDAVAYPEQFDRRSRSGPVEMAAIVPGGPSAQRAIGRLAVFGIILFTIVALVFFAASVNASAALLPMLAIDGTLYVDHAVPVVLEAP